MVEALQRSDVPDILPFLDLTLNELTLLSDSAPQSSVRSKVGGAGGWGWWSKVGKAGGRANVGMSQLITHTPMTSAPPPHLPWVGDNTFGV